MGGDARGWGIDKGCMGGDARGWGINGYGMGDGGVEGRKQITSNQTCVRHKMLTMTTLAAPGMSDEDECP